MDLCGIDQAAYDGPTCKRSVEGECGAQNDGCRYCRGYETVEDHVVDLPHPTREIVYCEVTPNPHLGMEMFDAWWREAKGQADTCPLPGSQLRCLLSGLCSITLVGCDVARFELWASQLPGWNRPSALGYPRYPLWFSWKKIVC